MLQDLKFALRSFRKNPAFASIAVVALALGIGANSAIFSVVDAIVLRPLPLPHPEQLVAVTTGRTRTSDGTLSWPDFADVRDQSRSYQGLVAYHGDQFILTGVGEPALVQGTTATANLFDVLGVHPALGRGFAPGEDAPGKSHVVVLSDTLWRKRFAADPNVVGRAITLDSQPYTVIGVAPKGLRFPLGSDDGGLFAPIPHGTFDGDLHQTRGGHYLQALGRLKAGTTIAQAQVELDTIQSRLAAAYGDDDAGRFMTATDLRQQLVGNLQPAMLVLLGAVGFVLLIACANVANLLLARATARQREIAIRTALGAGRGRIVRQLLTESTLLGLIGGGLGLVLALWSLDALVALIPDDVPRVSEIAIDGRVLLFTGVVAIATGLVFGLVPALHASRTDLHDALKAAGRTVSGGRARARAALLIGEIAVAMLLLVGAGLTLRSFSRLSSVDPGFNPHDVLTAGLALPDTRYKDDGHIISFYRELLGRLRALPGAQGAAVTIPLPYTKSNIGLKFSIDGRPPAPPDQPLVTAMRFVSPDYFKVMGVRLVRGRTFTASDDDPKAPPVVILNETAARKFFPGEDPIGKHVSLGFGKDLSREIVGITGDVRSNSLGEPAAAEMSTPFAQTPLPFLVALVRSPHAAGMASQVRAEVQAVDKDQPVDDTKTMDEYLSNSLAQERLSTLLLGIFAALALTLAAVGIYGVMSYTVTQRTRELGIRMALGARRGQVLRMVIVQGLRLTLIGVGLGGAGALALTRVLASQLYGISATDPSTFVGIAVLLIAVAMLASLLPARRATRVDPMIALRGD